MIIQILVSIRCRDAKNTSIIGSPFGIKTKVFFKKFHGHQGLSIGKIEVKSSFIEINTWNFTICNAGFNQPLTES